ncbi:dynein regulatory complex protein 1-like, partial [Astyanax mexicanus]
DVMADAAQREEREGPFGGSAPSLESESPQERIAARRLRIAARKEAEKRLELGIGAQPQVEKKEEELPAAFPETRKQWKQSQKKMLEEIDMYKETISSFQVESDARLLIRSSEILEAQRLREEKLEILAKSDLEDLKLMEEKCAEATAKNTPQELFEALEDLKQLGAEKIEVRKKVIEDLLGEIREADLSYETELKRDAEQIYLMVQKKQELKSSFKELQRKELDQIQSSLLDEEKAFLSSSYEKWEQKRKEIPYKQQEQFLEMMKQKEEHEDQLDELKVKKINEFTRMKSTLETQADLLQLKLEKAKAAKFLNDEKLDFSRQVVGFCEMEKSQIKSKQKRKLIKLYDTLKDLKAKCTQANKQSLEGKKALTDANKQASQKYRDMQKRSRDFAANAAKTHQEMRQMLEEEAMDLIQRALSLDQQIQAHIIDLDWVPPPMPFKARSPYQPQQTEAAESSTSKSARTAVDPESEQRVLQLLCEEASFLLDPDLLQLLSCMPKQEQTFIKLELICFALGIEKIEDLHGLVEFFVEYKQREKMGSSDIVRPDQVVKVLKAFTAQYSKRRQVSRSEDAVTRGRSADDSGDWESTASILPESKFRIWDILEDALKQYLSVLTVRFQTLAETRQLKQEITKLRLLAPPTDVFSVSEAPVGSHI